MEKKVLPNVASVIYESQERLYAAIDAGSMFAAQESLAKLRAAESARLEIMLANREIRGRLANTLEKIENTPALER
jgi:hypothetical protein